MADPNRRNGKHSPYLLGTKGLGADETPERGRFGDPGLGEQGAQGSRNAGTHKVPAMGRGMEAHRTPRADWGNLMEGTEPLQGRDWEDWQRMQGAPAASSGYRSYEVCVPLETKFALCIFCYWL